MFKAKISASVWKHTYLYMVKISRDSGDPWITSMVNLGDSYRKWLLRKENSFAQPFAILVAGYLDLN